MTRQDVLNVNLTRVGAIVGILVAAWALLTAATAILDTRYAKLHDVQRVEAKMDRLLDVACGFAPNHRACKP